MKGKRTLASVVTVETDDRGDYRFFWIAPGKYFLRAGGRVGISSGLNPLGNRLDGNRSLVPLAELLYPTAATLESAAPIDIRAGADLHGIDFRLERQKLLRIEGRVIDTQTGT
jgi:hypothetical protein